MSNQKNKEKKRRNAVREYKKWIENPYPLYDKKGNEFMPREGEEFVPMYDYRPKNKGESTGIKGIDKKYYVSNLGVVLSFNFSKTGKQNRPIVLSQSKSSGSYKVVAGGRKVHLLVFYSFAYASLNGDTDLKVDFGDAKVYEKEALKKIIRMVSRKSGGKEVHHINRDRGDNRLENLQLNDHVLHDILHNVYDADTAEKEWNMFIGGMDKYDKSKLNENEGIAVLKGDEKTGVKSKIITQEEIMEKIDPKGKLAIEIGRRFNEWNASINQAAVAVRNMIGDSIFEPESITFHIDNGIEEKVISLNNRTGVAKEENLQYLNDHEVDVYQSDGKIYIVPEGQLSKYI